MYLVRHTFRSSHTYLFLFFNISLQLTCSFDILFQNKLAAAHINSQKIPIPSQRCIFLGAVSPPYLVLCYLIEPSRAWCSGVALAPRRYENRGWGAEILALHCPRVVFSQRLFLLTNQYWHNISSLLELAYPPIFRYLWSIEVCTSCDITLKNL